MTIENKKKYLMSIDLGTTTLKVAIFNIKGEVVASETKICKQYGFSNVTLA